METPREHLDRIRERFTRSAEPFTEFVLSARSEEAERLAEAAVAALRDAGRAVVLDVACGPGTLARAFVPRAGFVIGADFTPAMLLQGRRALERAGVAGAAFVCADAGRLPFADASLDIAACSYALHHLLHPAQVVREMARVVRPGGRVAVVDVVVPEGANSEIHNRIERVRDPSHATTLGAGQMRALFVDAGLRVGTAGLAARERDFDDWMRVAGWSPDSAVYRETRRLLEESAPGDAAGFGPRVRPDTGRLTLIQKTLTIVAEKP